MGPTARASKPSQRCADVKPHGRDISGAGPGQQRCHPYLHLPGPENNIDQLVNGRSSMSSRLSSPAVTRGRSHRCARARATSSASRMKTTRLGVAVEYASRNTPDENSFQDPIISFLISARMRSIDAPGATSMIARIFIQIWAFMTVACSTRFLKAPAKATPSRRKYPVPAFPSDA